MFIAKALYKSSFGERDYLAIMDTKDGVVERVLYSDVKASGICLYNDGKYGGLHSETSGIARAFDEARKKESCEFRIYTYKKLGYIQFRGWEIKCVRASDNNVYSPRYICNKRTFDDIRLNFDNILYMFELRGCLVLRIVSNFLSSWSSVAFEKNGKCTYWKADMSEVIGDRSLALKIDMLSEV